MKDDYGQPILNLCVSDTNKELLLGAEGVIPLLVDSLLLDPQHPRKDNVAIFGETNWEAAKGPVQRVSSPLGLRASRAPCVHHLTRDVLCALAQDFAEAIAQLAMFPPGREALLQDPTVAEALQQVVADGWTSEARLSAESALAALSDRKPDAEQHEHRKEGQQHVMASYQWDVQEVVKRIVNELKVRGYRTWFGAPSLLSLVLHPRDDISHHRDAPAAASRSTDIRACCAFRPG